MQGMIFARDKLGLDTDIYSVKSGLACECTCIDCGKPVIAYKGDKKAWHFQHEAYSSGCTHAVETSLHKLVKGVFDKVKYLTLPSVSYMVNETKVEVAERHCICIKRAYVEKSFNSESVNFRPDIVLETSLGDLIYVEVFVTHKTSKKKRDAYRKNNCKAIEIRFKQDDWCSVRDLGTLTSMLMDKIICTDYDYEWISHPELNLVSKILDNKGVYYFNASGLSSIYCPSKGIIVDAKACKDCVFNIVATKKEIKCRGNLSKSELKVIMPDVVFPPEDINYNGKCKSCNSRNTKLIKLDVMETIARHCEDCKTHEKVYCPICGGNLDIKTNLDQRYDSYMSKFIGCDTCSFTLTYKTPSGEFADEMVMTGGLDAISSNNEIYVKDLASYRAVRSKKNK